MAAKASPTSATTAVAAGVKTPGTGAYSDPAQVGAMIQQMYPQYKNFDPVTLGQRWIDVHTPATGTGSGTTGTGLAGPIGTTPMTTTNPNQGQNVPDLSAFAKPIQQPKPQAPRVIISGLAGNTRGAQLTPMTTPYQPPQQPQQPQGLSTANINKLGF